MNNIIDYTKSVDNYLTKLSTAIDVIDKNTLSDVINVLLSVAEKGGTVYLLGNGGSASTASHMQNDFNCSQITLPNKRFNFCCLADNFATITALANDIDYEEIFRFQLERKLNPGALVLAISGSGNSQNILKAAEYAKKMGNGVIAMTGFDGGKLYAMADYNLHIPINDMQVTEDIHLVFNHIMICAIKSYYSDVS
jgi:D-sedoheptulose 7-phosphate isomerase